MFFRAEAELILPSHLVISNSIQIPIFPGVEKTLSFLRIIHLKEKSMIQITNNEGNKGIFFFSPLSYFPSISAKLKASFPP